MIYKITTGSGFYDANIYFVEVDEPTTDYGFIMDIVIDNLDSEGNLPDFEWCENDDIMIDNELVNKDEYIIGGNYSKVLVHYGYINIEEATSDDLENYPKIPLYRPIF